MERQLFSGLDYRADSAEYLYRQDEETSAIVSEILECAAAWGRCGFATEAERLWTELFDLGCGVYWRKDYQFNEILTALQFAHEQDPGSMLNRLNEQFVLAHHLVGTARGKTIAVAIEELIAFTARFSPGLALRMLEREEPWIYRPRALHKVVLELLQIQGTELRWVHALVATMGRWQDYTEYDEHTKPAMFAVYSSALHRHDHEATRRVYDMARYVFLVEKECPTDLGQWAAAWAEAGSAPPDVLRLYDPTDVLVRRVPRPGKISWIDRELPDEEFIRYVDIDSIKERYALRDERWVSLYENTEQRTDDRSGANQTRASKVRITIFGVTRGSTRPTLCEIDEEARRGALAPLRNRYRFELTRLEPASTQRLLGLGGRLVPIVQVSRSSFRGRHEPDLAAIVPELARTLGLERHDKDLLGYAVGGQQVVRSVEWQEAFDQGRRLHEPRSSGFLLEMDRELLLGWAGVRRCLCSEDFIGSLLLRIPRVTRESRCRTQATMSTARRAGWRLGTSWQVYANNLATSDAAQ